MLTLSKGKKQERAYEAAIEQLQADIDAIEQENARLKSLSAGQELQRMLILFSFRWFIANLMVLQRGV